MSSKILIISSSHDCSAVILENDKITHYIMEERLSRKKHDTDFIKILKYLIVTKNTNFDLAIFPKITSRFKQNNLKYQANLFTKKHYNILKKFNIKKISFTSHLNHHLDHAYSGFYNSMFDKALCFVFDGRGIDVDIDDNNYSYCERESVFLLEKNKKSQVIHRNYLMSNKKEYEKYIKVHNNIVLKIYPYYKNNINIQLNDKEFATTELSLGIEFDYFCLCFKFKPGESGKIMGLAQYKGYEDKLPKEYNNEMWKKRIISSNKLQKKFQESIIDKIKKYTKETGIDNIVISGGCALNCVANYEYLKYFKPENLWIDPIGFDAGLSLGIAYRIINEKLFDNII